VVCSASYQVRAFGVRSGMAIAQAARLCPRATFVPVPRSACGEKSREVAAVLRRWAPKVEPASIDEFYLDMTGTEAVYRHRPLEETAAAIRAEVAAESGLTVSIGGGGNRLIAKLATERAKPRVGSGGTGVLVIPPGAEAEFMATHALAEIPGVGPRLQARLRTYGLLTVPDALRVERPELERWLGPRTGAWLHQRIRGQASAGVEPDTEAKSMSREETFAKDIAADRDLEAELLQLTTRLTADLRHDRLLARCVTLKLRDFDFKTRQASKTLETAIDTDRAVFAVARELLRGLRARRRVPARLIGVGLSRFEVVEAGSQLSLLDTAAAVALETDRDRAVSRAVDRINARFGRDTVRPARLTRTGRPR